MLALVLLQNLNAQSIRIGLFRKAPVKSATITGSLGDYRLFADSVEITKLPLDQVLRIVADSNGIQVLSLNGTLGRFTTLVFQSKDSLADIKIKPAELKKEKLVTGKLIITALNYELKIINDVYLEEYISGVVESEAGHGSRPEFYKAQSIISRTYALANMHKHEAEGFNLCDQVHCQAFKGKCKSDEVIHKAAFDTRGIVIVDDSLKLITAAFHSNCGGQTANSEHVWTKAVPYLRSVKDSYCSTQPNAVWKKEISYVEWITYLRKYNFPVNDSSCVKNCTTFKQPYRMYCLSSCDKNLPFKSIRMDLNLKSAFFSMERAENGNLMIKGRGFGHGVGLCQEGAMKMAKLGFDYTTILKHYFTSIHIIDMKKLEFFSEE